MNETLGKKLSRTTAMPMTMTMPPIECRDFFRAHDPNSRWYQCGMQLCACIHFNKNEYERILFCNREWLDCIKQHTDVDHIHLDKPQ